MLPAHIHMPDKFAGSRSHVTDLLRRWGRGDRDALDRLMPIVYEELHRMASRYFAGVLSTSPSTVKREWALARAWRRREIDGSGVGNGWAAAVRSPGGMAGG